MPIPPRVTSKLHETLGPAAAEDLVTWLDEMRAEHREMMDAVQADFAEVRQDIRAVEVRIVERMETRLHSLETNLRGEIHAVETGLRGEIHAVETRLGERIHAVDNKVDKRHAELMQWSFLFWVGAVGAIAMLAGVLRG